MSFAASAFQNSGFQVDRGHVGRAKPRRHYYEIRGKLYFLSDEELEYVVHKILADEETPKAKKGKAVRVRAPSEWVPPQHPPFDWGVYEDLATEARVKHYPVLLDILQRVPSSEDEDVAILLLYA